MPKQSCALDSLKLQLMQEVCEMTKDVLWYQDSFFLRTESFKSASPLSPNEQRFYLRADTNVGDSVEDEWIIAYVLHRLSEKHSNLVVFVVCLCVI